MQYRALTPIGYNGKRYLEGEIIDLDEKAAAGLLKHNAVEPVDVQTIIGGDVAVEVIMEAQPDQVDDFIGEPLPAPEKPEKPEKPRTARK